MAQVSMTVRMDSQLKQQFNDLCKEIGMSINTAINIFANAAVRTHGIPFRINTYTYEPEDELLNDFRKYRAKVVAEGGPELTLDEINEEIRLARQEKTKRKSAVK
ncbi:MAG: type II toxin-antitoxin system RelB/DinJ family antitoxin [Paludibacteraceae bacterium]|nr:type II toxin-antitoxin system RelB/DinJ family antitoxin [Paludibacteraceae bacterium]